MSLGDPFGVTYAGSEKAGEAKSSFGQGIESAAGSVADAISNKNAVKNSLKKLGLLSDDGTLDQDKLKKLPPGMSVDLGGGLSYSAPQPQQDLASLIKLMGGKGGDNPLSGMKPKLTIGKSGPSIDFTEDPGSAIKSTTEDFLQGRNPNDLTPDDRKYLLTKLYDKDPSFAGAVDQVSNFKATSAETASSMGGKKTDIEGIAHIVNPNYSPEYEKQVQKTRLDITDSGYAGKMKQSLNTLIGHVDDMYEDMKSLNNGPNPTMNTIKNFMGNQAGMSNITKSHQAALAVARENDRLLSGTGGTSVTETQDWLKTIPINGSPEQQQAWLKQGESLFMKRAAPLQKNVNDILGKAGESWDILDPDSKAVLKKLGLGGQQQVSPKVQQMLQQYKQKYPGRSDQEILQAMQQQGVQ